MRDISLKKPEEVEKTEDDELLDRIAEKSSNPDNASLDGIDYIELTLELLQHVVC